MVAERMEQPSQIDMRRQLLGCCRLLESRQAESPTSLPSPSGLVQD